MRIGINARFLLKNKLEGIGWFTFEILKELVQLQPDDEFILFFDRPYDPSFIVADNITPVVIGPPARHPILFVCWFEYSVTRALKRYKVDVFFSPDNFCALRTAVPTLLVVHDLAYLHFPKQISRIQLAYYRYFTPRFLQKAKRIVTVSEYTKQDIVTNFDIAADKIAVVYNGIRPQFKPLTAVQKQAVRAKYTNGKGYFFYVGAVHPRKNIPRLIAAFDLFKQETNSPIQLLIAGRFSWKTGAVKDAYEAAKHQKDIQFLAYVSDEELPLLVGAATALTYVSLFEGFGVPLIEAMYCEIPILTSNVSSMPEIVADAGLLVDPQNVENIAKNMEKIVQDTDLQNIMIESAKSFRKRFRWKISAKKIQQELRKMA